MLIEQMIGWSRNTDREPGTWITPHGEYRLQADVDDMVDWMSSEGFELHSIRERLPNSVGRFVVSFWANDGGDVLSQGRTIKEAVVNAVSSHFYTKRSSL